MQRFKQSTNIAGWLVFAVSFLVYFFSVERVGSLWDCGEFITGAYKLEVVHPPGAPLFMITGRVFTFLAEIFSSNPEHIAFAVNLMSGMCTAFAAMFVCWSTIILGKLAMTNSRAVQPTAAETIALAGAGVVAGLTTAFSTSIWFSAVEGEVYAMSTFFTTLTLWSVLKWYHLPDEPKSDRWLLFAVYAAGLSIGVHLLSILTFPALALFYYFKKWKEHTVWGMLAAAVAGTALIGVIQTSIIVGIPKLWSAMELMMVNGFNLPFNTGIIPTILILGAIIGGGVYYARKTNNGLLMNVVMAAFLLMIGFSTIGVVVIRANANPPINMNDPSDPMRLLPYINREQYGERALLRGPLFDAKPEKTEEEDRYGQVGDQYDIVDRKLSYKFRSSDKMLFPRMGDYTQGRPALYRRWIEKPNGKPSMADNLEFMFQYQFGWMYWRYFFWNFAGRQNGEQGFYSWDKSSGNWLSGIKPLDEARLHNMDALPESMRTDEKRNRYYMLPFLFGLLGMIFHFSKRGNDAIGLLALFVITGLGIVIYSNQPPNEPRERDYVLVGSFFTYAMWVGMGVLALFDILRERTGLKGVSGAAVASAVVLIAPIIMGFQNFDDHTRRHHTGARDYASNFLESCAPNAIIFTYGDNDTYPLWYAQEVEGIRTDVRVVNLSLIAVDWYIDQLRRKVNDSPPIKMSIPREAYRGYLRNQVLYNPNNPRAGQRLPIQEVVKLVGENRPLTVNGGRTFETFLPTQQMYIPVDVAQARASGALTQIDTANVVNRIPIDIGSSYLIKDELAVLDILASNLWERPIYYAVTVRPEKMFGLQDYTQLEGLGMRIIPVKSQSDPQYSIMGSGRVAVDKVYENVMNKFRWGNFDRVETHVSTSYMPSIQSHRIVMLRTARTLLERGDRERAIALAKKYFEVFPHFNFPYDYNAMYFINVLTDAGAKEEAAKHLEILANETADYLTFYESLSDQVIESSYQQEYGLTLRTMTQAQAAARKIGDADLQTRMNDLFRDFDFGPVEGLN